MSHGGAESTPLRGAVPADSHRGTGALWLRGRAGAQPVAEVAPVQVYAAGSLREAFTEIARQHQARTGQKVALTFGASGLLRERIENGEPAHVFASADTDHPQRLAARGGWHAPVVFTRNALCALTSEQISASPETLLATLLRSDVRVGTSTPQGRPLRRLRLGAFSQGRCSAGRRLRRAGCQGPQAHWRRRLTPSAGPQGHVCVGDG
jgi:hypothetical protein